MAGRKETKTWQHHGDTMAPLSYRRACKYEVFIPDSLSTLQRSFDVETELAIAEAASAIWALNHVAQPALKPLARLLLRTESIASSKVEGMQLGVRTLAKAEAVSETNSDKVSPLAAEILSNIDAMEIAVEETSNSEKLSIKDIETIHKYLMESAPNHHIAGKLRDRQNWIGGNDHNPCDAAYVPPPPEYVRPLLEDLCDAMNSTELSPIVQAAFVHAQFETIHPFDDGNGRTGRALIHVLLRRRGLAVSYVPPISVILATSKDRYIRGLNDFREAGREAGWVRQFALATTSAANLARGYLIHIQTLVKKWEEKLRNGPNPREDSYAWKIIQILPGRPVITGPRAEELTGGSRPSVNAAIQKLVEAGVLLPVSGGKKNRSWEAVGLLDLLTRLEAGELPE